MVKLGFICEGVTDKLFVDSDNFKQFLLENNCILINAIFSGGNGNLLPKNITKHINSLKDDKVDKIFILTDLDKDKCITKTKLRINASDDISTIVAVKEMEAWFLSDSHLLSKIFGKPFEYQYPENDYEPYETLRKLFVENTGRGFGSKAKLTSIFISKGFSITNAAIHNNCPSAKYFVDKIIKLTQ